VVLDRALLNAVTDPHELLTALRPMIWPNEDSLAGAALYFDSISTVPAINILQVTDEYNHDLTTLILGVSFRTTIRLQDQRGRLGKLAQGLIDLACQYPYLIHVCGSFIRQLPRDLAICVRF